MKILQYNNLKFKELINFKFALIFALEFKTLEFKRTFIINYFIILN